MKEGSQEWKDLPTFARILTPKPTAEWQSQPGPHASQDATWAMQRVFDQGFRLSHGFPSVGNNSLEAKMRRGEFDPQTGHTAAPERTSGVKLKDWLAMKGATEDQDAGEQAEAVHESSVTEAEPVVDKDVKQEFLVGFQANIAPLGGTQTTESVLKAARMQMKATTALRGRFPMNPHFS